MLIVGQEGGSADLLRQPREALAEPLAADNADHEQLHGPRPGRQRPPRGFLSSQLAGQLERGSELRLRSRRFALCLVSKDEKGDPRKSAVAQKTAEQARGLIESI